MENLFEIGIYESHNYPNQYYWTAVYSDKELKICFISLRYFSSANLAKEDFDVKAQNYNIKNWEYKPNSIFNINDS